MSSEEIQIVEPSTPGPTASKGRRVAFNEPDEESDEGEYYEDETDEEDSDDEEEEEDSGMVELLANTLATPEGDTVCGALVQIARAMETQNKILIKMLSAVSKK